MKAASRPRANSGDGGGGSLLPNLIRRLSGDDFEMPLIDNEENFAEDLASSSPRAERRKSGAERRKSGAERRKSGGSVGSFDLSELFRPGQKAGVAAGRGIRSRSNSACSIPSLTGLVIGGAAEGDGSAAPDDYQALAARYEEESIRNREEVEYLKRKNEQLQKRLDAALKDMEDKATINQYAKLIVENMPRVSDSTYVLKLQSQLCKSLHKMGQMHNQLELVQKQSDETIRGLREQLIKQQSLLQKRRDSAGATAGTGAFEGQSARMADAQRELADALEGSSAGHDGEGIANDGGKGQQEEVDRN